MRRIWTLPAAALAFIYALPLLTVGISGADGAEKGNEVTAQTAAAPQREEESFDERTTVTLLTDGAVRELTLRDYLRGVVAAEMPASFPEEALKAQALAARTCALYRLKLYDDGMAVPECHGDAQLCGDPAHCEGYVDVDERAAELWGADAAHYLARIDEAVDATAGLIATYDGEPIAAVFHSASGPRTESALAVWGAELPYLQGVDSAGGEASPRYRAAVTIGEEEFKTKMLAAHPEMDFSEPADCWFRASNRSEAGGIIDVAVGGVRVSGPWLRQELGLNSTNFTYHAQDGILTFETVGCGHGVGLSQYGARAMAEDGASFDEIVRHYYTGVELTIKY